MSRNQEADKKKLLEQLSKTPIVEVACKKANVPRSTYYRWRKDIAFADACAEAIEESTGLINDMAESQLISAIKDGNLTAVMFWLKANNRNYATRLKIDARLRREPEELTPEQAAIVEQALIHAGLLLPASENEEPSNE
jgi:hypothetical protein